MNNSKLRENKFRGVSLRTGSFVVGGLVRANDKRGNCWAIKDTFYNINNGKCNIIPEVVIPETVGSFIELIDINGTEIYERDFVKCNYEHFNHIAVIEWDICNPCFVLVAIIDGEKDYNVIEYDFIKAGMMQIEVIGSVDKNLEILNQKEKC